MDDADHDEILRQCDGIDGVLDGIIEVPDLCNFTPESIVVPTRPSCGLPDSCTGRDGPQGVQSLYGEDGKLIYPAMQPGSEVMAVWRLYAGKPFSYSEVHDTSNSLSPIFFRRSILTPRIRTGSDTSSIPT